MINYARKVVEGGGVITFDIGTFDEKPRIVGPYLDIDDAQMKQLRAIRDALQDIER